MVGGNDDFVLIAQHLIFPPIEGLSGDGACGKAAREVVFAMPSTNWARCRVLIRQHQDEDIPRLNFVAFPSTFRFESAQLIVDA